MLTQENVLESFITYCDDMKVGCESATGIEKKWKNFQVELESIKSGLKNEDNIDKIIRLLEKEKTILQQIKNSVSSESPIGFKDTFKILKTMIMPLAFGSFSILAAMTSKWENAEYDKKTARSASITFGAFSALSTFFTADDISQIKEGKKKVLKQIENLISENNLKLLRYKSIGSSGIKSVKDYNNLSKAPNNLLKNIKPADAIDNKPSRQEIWEYGEKMQDDLVSFLKQYIATNKIFRTAFKKYLYRIDIKPTDYGDLFSVEITPYDDGFDDGEYDDNTFLYHLYDVATKYIEFKYKNWVGVIWKSIECTHSNVYVN